MLYECKHYITNRMTEDMTTMDTHWYCDLEVKESPDWCGLTQGTDDQFDCTISHGPRPSELTGPDQAFRGHLLDQRI